MSGIDDDWLACTEAFTADWRSGGPSPSEHECGETIDKLIAEIRRQSELIEGLRPLAKVGLEAIEGCCFQGVGFDGADIQDFASANGAIRGAIGGYDPDIHGESDICEPGDQWHEFPPAVMAAKRELEEGK